MRLFATMIGLYAWGLQFMIVYGVTALACARGFAHASLFGFGLVPLAVVASTALALAATGIALIASLRFGRRLADDPRPTDRFLVTMGLTIAGLSLVAIAWTGLPALFVPACG